MNLAKVNVDIDQEEIKKVIDEKINQVLHQTLFFWDINRMSELTCMSKSFLEQEILHDPRMKLLERRKQQGKRFWPVAESLEVIKQLMNEW